METMILATAALLPLLLPGPRATARHEDPQPVAGSEVDVAAARARFEALSTEAGEAWREWTREMRRQRLQARKEGKQFSADDQPSPLLPFVPRFQSAAEDYAGTEAAVPFLVWLFQNGEVGGEAVVPQTARKLFGEHAASPELAQLADRLPYLGRIVRDPEFARSACERLEEVNPHPLVKGWAVWTRNERLLEEGAVESPEFKALAEKLRALADAAQEEDFGGTVRRKLAMREKFSLGMVAPDIAGLDLDGVAFKLSDYKGNVLFVDFWGDW